MSTVIFVNLAIEILIGAAVGNAIRFWVKGLHLSLLTATVLGAAGAAIGGQLIQVAGGGGVDLASLLIQAAVSGVSAAIFTIIFGSLPEVKEY